MAQIAHVAVSDLRQSIREGRSAFVVGPARSGLTWLVNQTITVGFEPNAALSIRGLKTVDDARAYARKLLGLTRAMDHPSDLQLAMADLEASQKPRLLVVNDCHRASAEVRSWLLQAALEPVAGGRTAIPFVFEGAFDPDLELAAAFPAGYATQPLIHYVEPSIPWRVLTEVEEMVKARWRQSFTAALIPWLADITGGDVGFVHELLERLPNDGEIGDETLLAATKQVLANGKRAREIVETVKEVDDAELLKKAATGRGIRGVPPSTLESSSLKRAYSAGIVVFDGIAGVYRVRGPLTAQVVAKSVGTSAETVFEGRFILSRLLIFFAHIAAFELDVRTSLRPKRPLEIAERVTSTTGFEEYWKPIRDAVVKKCAPDPKTLGAFSEELKKILPDTKSILREVQARWGAEVSEDSILDRVTFSQLTGMARQADIWSSADEAVLGSINEYRNAFAHFRAEGYGRCENLLRTIGVARRSLEKAHDRPAVAAEPEAVEPSKGEAK